MGIRDLWTSLKPFSKRVPLESLKGQSVAIDLSCWVVGAQTAFPKENTKTPHLRNVYERTIELLFYDIHPVFVLDGEAPELKFRKITTRNAANTPTGSNIAPATKDRSRFNHLLSECEYLLKLMGLNCIDGKGEAEATCAYLYKKGFVSAVITEDSDCFGYGAQVVCRRYSKDDKCIDVFDIRPSINSINLDQRKIIVFALICGCDYTSGVRGVGRESVLKLFNHLKDDDVLERIRSWKTKPEFFETWEKKVREFSDKSFTEDLRSQMKNELQIRSKALQDPEFPNEGIIKEFLVPKDNVEELKQEWSKPDLSLLTEYFENKLCWDIDEILGKLLPVLTYWQIKYIHLMSRQEKVVYPKCIHTQLTSRGVPYLKVEWEDKYNYFRCITSRTTQTWTTIEKYEDIQRAYPELVRDFEENIPREKSVKRVQLETINCPETHTEVLMHAKPKRQRTLDSFFKKANPNNVSMTIKCTLEDFSEVSGLVERITGTATTPAAGHQIDMKDFSILLVNTVLKLRQTRYVRGVGIIEDEVRKEILRKIDATCKKSN